MKRANAHSKSAPTLRAQTAPTHGLGNSQLPSIWSNSSLPAPQRGGGSAPSSEYGLLPRRSASDASILRSLRMQASVRSSSPPRPGSSGYFSSNSRAQTPYLLSGLTDPAEAGNFRIEGVTRKMFKHEVMKEATASGLSVMLGEDPAKPGALTDGKEFSRATDGVEKSLRDLHRTLDTWDPLHPEGGQGSKKKRLSQGDGDDEDEEGESMRDKLEMYKMVRKIEPELPPLTPMPPLSKSLRLPDNDRIDYNLSLDAMSKSSDEFRKAAAAKNKAYREKEMYNIIVRRDGEISENKNKWDQALRKKKKQAEDVLASRRDGGNNPAVKNVPKDVVAEKWIVMYALAAFLQCARDEVLFNRKTPEERLEVIKKRQEDGNEKRTDGFHIQAIKMEEYMSDPTLTCRLDMLARLYQAKIRVRNKRDEAHLLAQCLNRWQPRAHIFLTFKNYVAMVKYLQDWWRRASTKLRDVREKFAKRWEKVEKFGTSGYYAVPPAGCPYVEVLEYGKRMAFLEHELRSRRFYGLSQIALWREDSVKWQAMTKVSRKEGLPPHRPSYLPPDHLTCESSKKPCREGCLGRFGDMEIQIMIKAARTKPKGSRPIPQKSARGKTSKPKKTKTDDELSDTPAPARLFGEAEADDLQRWGVLASALPPIGQKPGADEGEGAYP